MSQIDRKSITFKQAEGLEPLPSQLNLKELSPVIKARFWGYIYSQIEADLSYGLVTGTMGKASRAFAIQSGMLIDDWDARVGPVTRAWKRYFSEEASYADTLEFMEWYARYMDDPEVDRFINAVLVHERAAYRFIDGSIVALASPEEGVTVLKAIDATAKAGLSGAKAHLLNASSNLTAGKYADSVRESIHAVEAVMFKKTGITGSFTGALKEYAKANPMHTAFSEALVKLYGYTSNEQGVRHSLFDKGDADVTEKDALFMFGVCAAFVTYLL
ncbi:hypothetical protein [Rhizobium sp. IMFF44]|uniref:hypothetical protein n=1 Tax=Rhizobium sp. IMFF44 TaxID=3342350 RepID=UPI0035BA705C